ncbi:hypothetical protein HZC30_05630 [Candidatus Woesearchaeota archaeon]|nr:hypothetical protein [Candidatus Woesearchaeota archaeon]
MKLKTIIILFAIVILMVGIATWIITDYYTVKDTLTQEFDFNVVSGKVAGFNLDKDKMHFGITCAGCGSFRKFSLNNTHSYKEKIRFFIASEEDNLGEWFYFYPAAGTVIGLNQTKEFKVAISPPENATPKMYEGKIIILTYKAWPWESVKDPPESRELKEIISTRAYNIWQGKLI